MHHRIVGTRVFADATPASLPQMEGSSLGITSLRCFLWLGFHCILDQAVEQQDDLRVVGIASVQRLAVEVTYLALYRRVEFF